MTPFESGTWFDGSTLTNHQLGQPTNSQCQFVDTPLGACQNLPFTSGKTYTATQNITVTLNGTPYMVRSNTLTVSDTAGSAGFGHGSITNGIINEINVSR